MTQQAIAKILNNLPQDSGVYRFFGLDDNLLYIGKAKNLKNRVSSYFRASRIADNQRLKNMVDQIDRVDWTVVKTEKEALILEANLIHNLQPKYNIALKDDKSYLYVRINSSSPITNITLTRRKYDKKSDYFGPYTKKYGISNILRILRIILPYCEKPSPDGKPCQYVQLKQCDGICCGKESLSDYNIKIDQIKMVLNGKISQVQAWLKSKIKDAIVIENYELAGLWRDKLFLLEDVISDQKIIFPQEQDLDIITIIVRQSSDPINPINVGSVFVQNIRAGKMINLNNFILSGQDYFEESDEETGENNADFENNMENNMENDFENTLQPNELNNATTNSNNSINSNSEIQLQSSTFALVKRFMLDYYAKKTEPVEVLLQVWND